MGKAPGNLQETFLNLCRKDGTRCIVYLCNGVQLRGVISAFDSFTILLEDESKQQLVYKHAVTTVQPMKRMAAIYKAMVQDGEPASDEQPEPEVEAATEQ